MIEKITIIGGRNKKGQQEAVKSLNIHSGEILAIVGPTGSGKSQLISDIEQWADGETPSGRQILINDVPAVEYAEQSSLRRLVAEVSQNMNFVIDMTVKDFLSLHATSRKIDDPDSIINRVVEYANQLTGEPIHPDHNVTSLSGGQSRALMVADVALISNAPIVLIDEIENAGIDRLKALKLLTVQKKVVIVVTHDPMLALMADKRIIMKNGGMIDIKFVTKEEKVILEELMMIDRNVALLREELRKGGEIRHSIFDGGHLSIHQVS